MKNNSGNILFIILIAVALFAALSYAVTNSTRSQGQGTSKEVALSDSSVIQQYTANLRGATTRMVADAYVSLEGLQFNPPSDFGNLTSDRFGVFHGSGGGIVYQMASVSVIDPTGDNPSGQWVYTLNFEVDGIGTSSAGNLDGNEIMAFLVGISEPTCIQINSRLGLPVSPIPTVTGSAYGDDMISNLDNYYMDHDYVLPATETVIGAGAGDASLSGAYEGCYEETSGNNYVYFSVISQR